MIGRRDLFPARRDSTEASRRHDTSPATPTAGGHPATTQPDTGQEAHPGWHLPDLARYWVRELLPPVTLLVCSYRVSEWLATVLAGVWVLYRAATKPHLRGTSRSLARMERSPRRRP